jgi:hypothetical protein
MARVIPAPNGMKGFDTAQKLSYETAHSLWDQGMRFAMRYVSRTAPAHGYDLDRSERDAIHRAGLALGVVQHVEKDGPPWWTPTTDKGAAYGYMAGEQARLAGVTPGATVFLDLEGIVPGTPVPVVTEYCNLWHKAVSAAGYHPGIYVGYGAILNAYGLYHNLRFDRYWGAYNLNRDQEPQKRGICMKQHSQQTIAGITLDPDTITQDALGGVPLFDAPDEFQA